MNAAPRPERAGYEVRRDDGAARANPLGTVAALRGLP
jgi:hypothetical protein